MSLKNKKLPKWFDGLHYPEGETVTNPFSGEEFYLNKTELSMYDFIMGCNSIFEEDDIWTIQSIFAGQGPMLPEEIMKADENNNALFFEFYDGAKEMWLSMKDALEEKGYEI